MNNSKAVVLVSGGLDSATTLAIAGNEGYSCYALSFDYGQRHIAELKAAQKVASSLQAEAHKTIKINLRQFGGSALTDENIRVPELPVDGIPVTYVPARNTIFLAYALAYAEVISAGDIFIGVNAVDYSGYPDCRPEFIAAFEKTAQLATRAGIEGNYLKIHTPIIDLGKHEIITLGNSLGVDYSITVSCYQADANGLACGKCDACRFRKEGFQNASLPDPTRYK
jgi:7-cyano-7-deazaguanine synthase